MNKVLVRVLALLAVVAVVLVLVAVMRKGPTGLRFALVPKTIGHPYWEGVRQGMEAEAKRLGVQAVFQGPPEAGIEQQITIIEGLMAEGYDGIGISPNDPEAVQEVIKRAAAKGIAVVTFDSDSPGSVRLMYIGTDNRAGGRVAAKEMITILGAKKAGETDEKLLVQMIGGTPGAWNLKERMEGFAEGVKGTNIVLAPTLFNEEKVDTSLQVAESAIIAHPELRAFFCSNAFAGPGAALAIQGAIQRGKLKAGQIHVVAFDTTEDILNYIEQGLIDCTLAQNTGKMGAVSLEKLLLFARQHKSTGSFQGPPKGQDVIDTGLTVVWPKDVPKFRTGPAKPKAAAPAPSTAPAASRPAD